MKKIIVDIFIKNKYTQLKILNHMNKYELKYIMWIYWVHKMCDCKYRTYKKLARYFHNFNFKIFSQLFIK